MPSKTPPQLDALAAFAVALCDAARPIARRYFRTPVAIEGKQDLSPVTIADRTIEQALRRMIGERHPDHGILGEEEGAERTDAPYVWVIDPIDGTRAFITGKPTFGTLVALLFEGRPVVGVVDVSMLGDRWLGVAGRPTLLGDAPARARGCRRLADAYLSTTSPQMFAEPQEGDAFRRLLGTVKSTVYGGDCFAYGLLSSGFIDVVCEAGLKPYDYCALIPVIEGAGGRIADWQGQPLHLGAKGQVVAVGDQALLELAIDVLRGEGSRARS
ncbi:MAG: histidinol-phosphatase [Alphaproteobacteria bacterium]|nr:histidinol-phosphatase [Alphaproteobacteria bacterium]